MKTKYTVFTRTSMKNRTILPKLAQSARVIKFFVRSSLASRFPKRLERKAIYMADLIMADGIIIKNTLGANNE